MRILHVINELGDRGNGITNVAVDLACHQSDRHQVAVASPIGNLKALLSRRGVQHYHLDSRFIFLMRDALSWRAILRDFQPDVVHVHVALGVLLNSFPSSVPYRVVTTVHNSFRAAARLLVCADAVVSVSRAVESEMLRRGLRKDRSFVIHNGTIGSPRRKPAEILEPERLSQPAVVALGAVSLRKGSDLLLSAFSRLPPRHSDAHLYFVGNNDLADFSARTEKLRVENRVHLAGFSSTPGSFLRAATLLVQASRRDPFPLALLEAKEAGTAVIAAAVDGIPEALDYGASGCLVPANDPEALGHAICRFLDDRDLLGRYRRASLESAKQYTVDRMASEYFKVYLHVLRDQENLDGGYFGPGNGI